MEWKAPDDALERPHARVDSTDPVQSPQECSLDSVLTDVALRELKEQAPEGCVFCSFEAWDEEGED